MQSIGTLLINYGGIFAIPLWIGIPWSIRKFRKKYDEAHSEVEQDFKKLDKILDEENCEKNVRKYLKDIERKEQNKQYWFWETELDIFVAYWVATFFSSVALIVSLIRIINGRAQ
jgi:hypothetical protein